MYVGMYVYVFIYVCVYVCMYVYFIQHQCTKYDTIEVPC